MGLNEPTLNLTIGALLASVLISSCVFGILTVQVSIYFGRFKNDPKLIKAMVVIIWTVDGLHLLLTCITLYDFIITNFGNAAHLGQTDWIISTWFSLEPIIVYMEHLYFARRAWLLSGKKKIWPAALIIVLGSFTFVFGLWVTFTTYKLHSWSEWSAYQWAVGVWLAALTSTDIIITINVSYTLWHSKTGFRDTDHTLTKLIVWSLNTGALLVLCAAAAIITFVFMSNTLVHIALGHFIARIVGSTVLASLNRRGTMFRHRREIRMTDEPIGREILGSNDTYRGSSTDESCYVEAMELETIVLSENRHDM